MNPGQTVFAQVITGIDRTELARAAARFPMPRASRSLSVYDHFAAMIFAQLTHRESLRDIAACLQARPQLLYHMGIRGRVTRTNVAYANEHRDSRVFAEAAAVLMRRARRLYADTPPPLGLEADLFALDATLIDLSLALFPWARWQGTQAALKLDVLLNLRDDIPVFASLHEADQHEVATLDELPLSAGSYYVMDRGYLDFARLYRMHKAHVFFVTRLKRNILFYVVASRSADKTTGIRCDQSIRLRSADGRRHYPELLRRIGYHDAETDKRLYFVTNNFALPAITIAQIYRHRWGIELFFRWIKQHLRLRGFYSLSPNGVRVQIWTALCAHLLVAIAKQQYCLQQPLYEILQIFSVSSFEKVPLGELFAKLDTTITNVDIPNQLELSGF